MSTGNTPYITPCEFCGTGWGAHKKNKPCSDAKLFKEWQLNNMNKDCRTTLENWILDYADAKYLVSEENANPLLLKANLEGAINYISNLLKEEREKTLEEERRFILNILDGIDIADKKAGVIGGTKAIRQALQSRI